MSNREQRMSDATKFPSISMRFASRSRSILLFVITFTLLPSVTSFALGNLFHFFIFVRNSILKLNSCIERIFPLSSNSSNEFDMYDAYKTAKDSTKSGFRINFIMIFAFHSERSL